MTGGVEKTFCILGRQRIVTGRGPVLLLLLMIRRSGAATKTKHSDQLRSMQSLLPLLWKTQNNVAARSHCSANEMDGARGGGDVV